MLVVPQKKTCPRRKQTSQICGKQNKHYFGRQKHIEPNVLTKRNKLESNKSEIVFLDSATPSQTQNCQPPAGTIGNGVFRLPSRPVGIYFPKRFVRDRAPFLADSGPPGAGALGGGGVLGGPGAEIPGGRRRNCRRHGGDEKPGSGIKRTLT